MVEAMRKLEAGRVIFGPRGVSLLTVLNSYQIHRDS